MGLTININKTNLTVLSKYQEINVSSDWGDPLSESKNTKIWAPIITSDLNNEIDIRRKIKVVRK